MVGPKASINPPARPPRILETSKDVYDGASPDHMFVARNKTSESNIVYRLLMSDANGRAKRFYKAKISLHAS